MYALVVMNNNAETDFCIAPDINICEVIILTATGLLLLMVLVHR